MNIQSVVYEPVDAVLLPGKTFRIIITGADIEARAEPVVAEVGPQAVLSVTPLIGAERGVQGFLETEPAAGDELRIGYADEELQPTGFKYDPNVA